MLRMYLFEKKFSIVYPDISILPQNLYPLYVMNLMNVTNVSVRERKITPKVVLLLVTFLISLTLCMFESNECYECICLKERKNIYSIVYSDISILPQYLDPLYVMNLMNVTNVSVQEKNIQRLS